MHRTQKEVKMEREGGVGDRMRREGKRAGGVGEKGCRGQNEEGGKESRRM